MRCDIRDDDYDDDDGLVICFHLIKSALKTHRTLHVVRGVMILIKRKLSAPNMYKYFGLSGMYKTKL